VKILSEVVVTSRSDPRLPLATAGLRPLRSRIWLRLLAAAFLEKSAYRARAEHEPRLRQSLCDTLGSEVSISSWWFENSASEP
jgi:hypothetical protein